MKDFEKKIYRNIINTNYYPFLYALTTDYPGLTCPLFVLNCLDTNFLSEKHVSLDENRMG